MNGVRAAGSLIVGLMLIAPAIAQDTPAPATPVSPSSNGDVPPQPIGDPRQAYTVADYPVAALRNNDQGRVTVSLDIDAAGRPSRCTVTTSSGFASLDEVTCAVAMRTARFVPATRNGMHVAGTYGPLSINWKLPNDGPELRTGESFVMTDFDAEYALDTHGEVVSCTVVRVGERGGDPCKNAPVGKQMAAAPMRNGQPVTSKLRVTIKYVLTAD